MLLFSQFTGDSLCNAKHRWLIMICLLLVFRHSVLSSSPPDSVCKFHINVNSRPADGVYGSFYELSSHGITLSADMDCSFNFVGPQDKHMMAMFLDINCEPQCNRDSLFVNHVDAFGSLVAKGPFQGDQSPWKIRSYHNELKIIIQYKTNNTAYIYGSVFVETISSENAQLPPPINNVLTLRSPNYPLQYAANTSIAWYYIASEIHNQYLVVPDLDLEQASDGTCVDSLIVYGWDNAAVAKGEPTIVSFLCKIEEKDYPVFTRFPEMKFIVIRFVSDQSIHGRGFEASIFLSNKSCGGIESLDAGSLIVPHGPNNNPFAKSPISCVWILRTGTDIKVMIDNRPSGYFVCDGAEVAYHRLQRQKYGRARSNLLLKHRIRCDISSSHKLNFTSTVVYHFQGDSNMMTADFNVQYIKSSADCGDILQNTGKLQALSLEFYDSIQLVKQRNCFYLVKGNSAFSPSFKFWNINLPLSTNLCCKTAYFALYDFENYMKQEIIATCGKAEYRQIPGKATVLQFQAAAPLGIQKMNARIEFTMIEAAPIPPYGKVINETGTRCVTLPPPLTTFATNPSVATDIITGTGGPITGGPQPKPKTTLPSENASIKNYIFYAVGALALLCVVVAAAVVCRRRRKSTMKSPKSPQDLKLNLVPKTESLALVSMRNSENPNSPSDSVFNREVSKQFSNAWKQHGSNKNNDEKYRDSVASMAEINPLYGRTGSNSATGSISRSSVLSADSGVHDEDLESANPYYERSCSQKDSNCDRENPYYSKSSLKKGVPRGSNFNQVNPYYKGSLCSVKEGTIYANPGETPPSKTDNQIYSYAAPTKEDPYVAMDCNSEYAYMYTNPVAQAKEAKDSLKASTKQEKIYESPDGEIDSEDEPSKV